VSNLTWAIFNTFLRPINAKGAKYNITNVLRHTHTHCTIMAF